MLQTYILVLGRYNMGNKAFIIGIIIILLVLISISAGSAYYGGYYGGYGDDSFKRTSYSRTTTSGYGGFVNTRHMDYDRTTSSYWDHGNYVKRTSYVRTTVDTPYRHYGYEGYGYKPSGYYANNYRYGGYYGTGYNYRY